MGKYILRFKNSILFFMEMLLYVVNYLVFFLLLGIDNKQLLVPSRTSVVITFTWIIVTALLTVIYGKWDVGYKKSRPIIMSLTITAFLRDIVAYLLLNIMNRNEDNNKTFKIEFAGIFLLILVIHALWIILMTYAGNGFFFYARKPLNTVLVYPEEYSGKHGEQRLKGIIERFHKMYRIADSVPVSSTELYGRIKDAEAVFLYDLGIEKRTELVNYCYQQKKNVYFNPEISDILTASAKQYMFDDTVFLSSEVHTISYEQRIIKRLMDIGISLIALICSSPVFLVAAVMIKACDGGPVFFRQDRATIFGKVFSIYKFRTMRVNAPNRSATKDDDRITPAGKILRKYRLDELPQFINILKGDMSVVGPRPEMMENVREYTEKMPEFSYRLRMKAGLTGYAQILGKYNTSSKDKLILDLLYIENFSVFKDIQLMFQTVFVLLKAEDSTEGFNREED